MEKPVGCCGMATVMRGWTAAVGRRCSTATLVIQRDNLQRRHDLARSPEKRKSVRGPGRRRGRHLIWTRRATALVIFFRFSLRSLRVWFRATSWRRCPTLGIMFSPLSPRFVGVFTAGGGRVEPCLQRVFPDPGGLSFRWICLVRPAFVVLRVSTGSYWHYLLQDGDLLCILQPSASPGLHRLLSDRCFYKLLSLRNFSPPRRTTRCIELCSRRAVDGCRRKKTSPLPRI